MKPASWNSFRNSSANEGIEKNRLALPCATLFESMQLTLFEEIDQRSITAYIEILLHAFSFFETQLCHIVASIVPEQHPSARFQIPITIFDHITHPVEFQYSKFKKMNSKCHRKCLLFWFDGRQNENQHDDIHGILSEWNTFGPLFIGRIQHKYLTTLCIEIIVRPQNIDGT